MEVEELKTLPPLGKGGARPGAGRPRKQASELVKREKFPQRLQPGYVLGSEFLASKYRDLLSLAVELAVGRHESCEGKPNIALLRTLLDLGPKLSLFYLEPNDSPIAKLLREFSKGPRGDLNLTQINTERVTVRQ